MLFFRVSRCLLLPAFSLLPVFLAAQSPTPRLTHEIRNESRTALSGSRSPIVQSRSVQDTGPVPEGRPVSGITLALKRSSAQEEELQELLRAQLDPTSPQFHRWITPDQFAVRFGLAESDLTKVTQWLEQQGFRVEATGRSRDRITFSGSAGQVASAFGAPLHQFRTASGEQFAPAGELSVPADLAPLVGAVLHLSTFRPAPQAHPGRAVPRYTTAATQTHYLDPLDLATQYDVTPLYTAGVRGTGQSIAIVGQTYVRSYDFNSFGIALGLGSLSNYPVLIPNSGVEAISPGDEAESDLDLEYSTALAPGAQLFFVHVGDNQMYNVYDALRFAVTTDIAPIISISYGGCELDFSAAERNDLIQITEQASLQGQTVIAADGDFGSNSCFYDRDLPAAQQQTPAVQLPSSLANVTAMGGLQLAANTFSPGNSRYFSGASGLDTTASLQAYVPEVVWNEDSATHGRLAGGGGTSTAIPRPAWQTGVPGITPGAYRTVPDLALEASAFSPGYIFCTSDPSFSEDGPVSSCFNGTFLDAANGSLQTGGGTSFAAPVFAGMLALLNQATHAAGQGNINPVLYQLAANAGTFSAAFHDITGGGNQCNLGAALCSSVATTSYMAGVGYDLASGLGSIDLANLVAAWPATPATRLQSTQTEVGLEGNTLGAGSQQRVSVSVRPLAYGNNVTGTLNVSLDGDPIAAAASTDAGVAGIAFTVPASSGTHVLTARYSGDAQYAASVGSNTFEVGSSAATGSFTLHATDITMAANGTGTGTITVTPASGYTGAVGFSLFVSASTPALCYRLGQVSAYTGMPTSITLTLGTGTACAAPLAEGAATSRFRRLDGPQRAANPVPRSGKHGAARSIAFGSLLISTLCLWRRRTWLRPMLSVLLITSFGFGINGCGGSKTGGVTTPTPALPTTQTLVLSVNGADSINSSIESSTTLTVAVTQ